MTIRVIVLFLLYISSTAEYCKDPVVLLVSFDGFRWNYWNKTRVALPHFDQVATEGVRVTQLINAFVTKTFPNHYTLVTGLYPESHGIISNKFWGPKKDQVFTMSSCEDWWNEGEPLWVTAEKQGKKSAVFFWPGSECDINGYKPTIYKHYDSSVPFDDRIKTVISWLQNEDCTKQPKFVALYFREPDHTGHTYGPESPQVTEILKMVDGLVNKIRTGLKESKLQDTVNVIFTSDHGMATLNQKVIHLEDYVDIDLFYTANEGPNTDLTLWPKELKRKEILQKLVHAHPHMHAWDKYSTIPTRLHYSKNDRIAPIVVLADKGWLIAVKKDSRPVSVHGMHGYDNKESDMHPFFMAVGPAFKKGFQMDSMHNTDIYPLVCSILDLKAAPNNGTLSASGKLLQHAPHVGPSPPNVPIVDPNEVLPVIIPHFELGPPDHFETNLPLWQVMALGATGLIVVLVAATLVVVRCTRRKKKGGVPPPRTAVHTPQPNPSDADDVPLREIVAGDTKSETSEGGDLQRGQDVQQEGKEGEGADPASSSAGVVDEPPAPPPAGDG
eukprot:TRINITY_DN14088_c0_g1_i1.p1 TRINITY_DN14088_c0_g1~~TRINITY_DN14088_c0_g1_i1.p1  ORF type:complete len:555 (+),score=38.91 TRINITY_DN14088_c0_g1_i1:32-1696(+)